MVNDCDLKVAVATSFTTDAFIYFNTEYFLEIKLSEQRVGGSFN